MKCGSHKCANEAVTVFIWPGSQEMPACLGCAMRAWKVMGFTLTFQPHQLCVLENVAAKEVIDYVKRDE